MDNLRRQGTVCLVFPISDTEKFCLRGKPTGVPICLMSALKIWQKSRDLRLSNVSREEFSNHHGDGRNPGQISTKLPSRACSALIRPCCVDQRKEHRPFWFCNRPDQ